LDHLIPESAVVGQVSGRIPLLSFVDCKLQVTFIGCVCSQDFESPAAQRLPMSQFPERKNQAMKVNTYLNFPGNCQEAMNFYEKNLGAKILMKSTFAEMSSQGAPQNLPPGLNRDGIIHARFTLGDTTVMASDGPNVEPMRSAYLTLSVDSDAEAERIYSALTEGGEVFMKMGETFFAHRFGQFRDKFGVNWMVIHEKPMQRPN
jgi:PhnB protein